MTALPRILSFVIGGMVVGLAATQSFSASLDSWPANARAVLASVAFPEPPAPTTIDDPAQEKALDSDEPTPSRPPGCEAAASMTIDPTLIRLVGRCFA
jgi:hypothetical protein